MRKLPGKWIGIFDEDDLVQEVLLSLKKTGALAKLDPARGTLRMFAYQYTSSRLLDILRREKRRTEIFESLKDASMEELGNLPVSLPDEVLEMRQRWAEVTELTRLSLPSEKAREMFELIILRGYSAEECARRGISRANYHTWKHRLLKAMKSSLEVADHRA